MTTPRATQLNASHNSPHSQPENKLRRFLCIWPLNSLKTRLIISALMMTLVLLPIIGITLNNAFDKQLKTTIESELRAYSYSLLAVAEVEHNQLVMPEQFHENQFNVIQSGLYAMINVANNSLVEATYIDNSTADQNDKSKPSNTTSILWKSPSLLGVSIPQNLSLPKVGQFLFTQHRLEENTFWIYSFSANFIHNGQDFPFTLHIIKDQSQYQNLKAEFNQQLWTWLLVLMIVFFGLQWIWFYWSLKPLTQLSDELKSVEQGKTSELEGVYPLELLQVTQQLNDLLETEKNQRKRYRNALSDLAHSLKTPLAVIQSQSDLSPELTEQVTQISQMIEHQLKKAQSAGESSWHIGVSVNSVLMPLIHALNKIYHDKNIAIKYNIDEQSIFKGDLVDLMEILGNLLDNAYKAAKSQVFIEVSTLHKKLMIVISDDGSGIAPSLKENILNRGTRADTYAQGHGIGLAIVRDLVASYQGQIEISESPSLKGAQFTLIF